MPSKTKIDQLGDRIRLGSPSADDLRLLDEYRLSFSEAYDHVMETLRTPLQTVPSGRAAKSQQSIIDKLRRESIRLTQMQDIAGCRIVVSGIDEQDQIARGICNVFADTRFVNRRKERKHGYRAIHLIVTSKGLPIEIQVRTSFQQIWAELSEKAADLLDPEIKYGGGPPEIQDQLTLFSSSIELQEGEEAVYKSSRSLLEAIPSIGSSAELELMGKRIQTRSDELRSIAADLNSWVDRLHSGQEKDN